MRCLVCFLLAWTTSSVAVPSEGTECVFLFQERVGGGEAKVYPPPKPAVYYPGLIEFEPDAVIIDRFLTPLVVRYIMESDRFRIREIDPFSVLEYELMVTDSGDVTYVEYRKQFFNRGFIAKSMARAILRRLREELSSGYKDGYQWVFYVLQSQLPSLQKYTEDSFEWPMAAFKPQPLRDVIQMTGVEQVSKQGQDRLVFFATGRKAVWERWNAEGPLTERVTVSQRGYTEHLKLLQNENQNAMMSPLTAQGIIAYAYHHAALGQTDKALRMFYEFVSAEVPQIFATDDQTRSPNRPSNMNKQRYDRDFGFNQ